MCFFKVHNTNSLVDLLFYLDSFLVFLFVVNFYNPIVVLQEPLSELTSQVELVDRNISKLEGALRQAEERPK